MSNVLIVYHFFPHYRRAVIESLLSSDRNRYTLAGDVVSPCGSIRSWVPANPSKLNVTKCLQAGPILLQTGLIKQALRQDIDCMIFLGNYLWPLTWMSALVARSRGKRVLFWTHGWTQEERGLKRLLRNTFYRLAHGLLLYGNRAKDIGCAYGFDPRNMYVIYNSLDYEQQLRIRDGISEDRLAAVRSSLFSDPSLPIVICTSRLTKVRELSLLLDAASLLQSREVNINILLIGAGPEEDRLRLQAQKLSLRVNLFGACYQEETLAEMIMASRVSVAPGKVGLTAMHSLVYGTPVITHNDPNNQMPEWEAIEEGKSGALFTRGNVDSLADSIETIVCKRVSKDTRKQCSAIIDRFYNPAYQVEEINRAVAGEAAQ